MKKSANILTTMLRNMKRQKVETAFKDLPLIDVKQVIQLDNILVVELQDGCGRTCFFEMNILTFATYFSMQATSINILQRLVYEGKVLANNLYSGTVILEEEPFSCHLMTE